ncbi:GH36-type glycosyl hydrolase domain-containing protein [Clostridium sp. UBA4395]|uniref:GH36-type glycosyl hydrolase domain-containing protein n=1 Tax=Clostridium sp. UBA4395 TaxID=1946360 RepID=UPI0032168D43
MEHIFILVNLILILSIVLLMYVIKNRNKRRAYIKISDNSFLAENKEKLEDAIDDIARDHREIEKISRNDLISNLDKHFNNILGCHNLFKVDENREYFKIKGTQWILDNIYVIEKEYKFIKKHLSKKYLKSLPILKSGALKGYPRIYAVSREVLGIYRDKLTRDNINKFLKRYQETTILTMGELWALPIMLKIAYLEIIGKSSVLIVDKANDRHRGERLADRIIKYYNEENMKRAMDFISENNIKFTEYFADALIRVLRDNGVNYDELNLWIEDKLSENEITLDKIIIDSNKSDGIYSTAISSSINGLRNLDNINWEEVFNTSNKVEEILSKDPAMVYSTMDFYSKDYYRHVLEKIARQNKISETFVARKVLQCAEENNDKEFENHVGYYLIDSGREKLNHILNIDFKGFEKLKNMIKGRAVGIYIGTIVILTAILLGGFITWSYINDTNISISKYILSGIVTIIPLSEVVVSILNWSITNLSIPNVLPKINISDRIPKEGITCVVVPTLIESIEKAKSLIRNLETYYLGNNDENLYFAILGDFIDSHREKEAEDEVISKFCLEEINKLNTKYKEDNDRFFFLCRHRRFNEKENKWIGWERKRGKLEEFNKFIRGDKNTTYSVFSEGAEKLFKVKYVITLDGDTILPRESAKILIGSMLHPLNRAYTKEDGTVWRGYGVIQPKIGIDLESANKTYFSKVFSGEAGIDIYTFAISDVYQDLFGEGIFTGKAIYDVDVFTKVTQGVIEENQVLSHDLLEGSLARTALLTDVELVDGYPSNFIASCKRLHRWVRGDWQLLPYILKKNKLNRLSKWKMIDNLRRSLMAPSMLILLLCSLAGILPDGIDKWYMSAFIALITPILFNMSENIVSPINGISLSGKVQNFQMALKQVFFIYAFLPFKAYLMVDAIIRTLYRLIISKKNLLQWQTAEEAERSSGKDFISYFKYMWQEIVIALCIMVVAWRSGLDTFYVMIPSCIIWVISPIIAYIIGQNINDETVKLSEDDNKVLKRLTRRIWAYFEDFVTENTNYLGGDNYQEEPYRGLAMRTSPTNIGMTLISNIVAIDMGYIGTVKGIENLGKTIDTLKRLETCKGHFYNWYDVETLSPLLPKYVSTVDSGNLVSYLYTIEEVLKELRNTPYFNNRVEGIEDTVYLAMEELEDERKKYMYLNVIERIKREGKDILTFYNILNNFEDIVQEDIENIDSAYWNKKLLDNIKDYLSEIKFLFPFIDDIKLLPKSKYENIIRIISSDSLGHIYDIIKGFNFISNNLNEFQLERINKNIDLCKERVGTLLKEFTKIEAELNKIIDNTDFKFLYNDERKLFHIGYDVDNESLSSNYYDLLASEARTTSFIAVAKGIVPTSHWFALNRSLTLMYGRKGLASWSGTMFEYFMPRILIKNYRNSMLDETYRSVMEGQIRYGDKRKVPFGISESAYYKFDVDLNYQYKAFGVPKVGIKRGLDEELVVSPYSTIMGLMENIPKSMANIRSLLKLECYGRYGFYEAIDYTDKRIKNKKFELVKCYMIHHLGMSLLALDNVMNNNIIQRRFHRIPMIRAVEILLQEKISKNVVYDRKEDNSQEVKEMQRQYSIHRTFKFGESKYPQTILLGNKNYNILLNTAGGGYSKFKNVMVYRWKEDLIRSSWGKFFYIKDTNSNEYTSSTYEPCKEQGDKYEVNFYLYKAEFIKYWRDLEINTIVQVIPEDNCEIRTIDIKNNGSEEKIIEVISYSEVVLQGYSGDISHPTFGNLFITTEYIDELSGILAKRRPRSEKDRDIYTLESTLSEEEFKTEYDTARLSFIGRNHSKENPIVLEENEPLKNNVGNVLDPIIAIKRIIKIPKGESKSVKYITITGNSKEDVLNKSRNYQDINILEESILRSALSVEESLINKGIKPTQGIIYERFASSILFNNFSYTKRINNLINLSRSQRNLWAYGISGDLPIVLLTINKEKESDILRQLINCHGYLEEKGLKFDIVVINEEEISYEKPLDNALKRIILNSSLNGRENTSGGIFIINNEKMSKEDLNLLYSIAAIIVDGSEGPLLKQIEKAMKNEDYPYDSRKYIWEMSELKEANLSYSDSNIPKVETSELSFFNGYGGFNNEGEYTIILKDGMSTPAPWINVIANNNRFGFNISESGSSYTWYKNSREFKITPWNNDFIEDTPSEVLYLEEGDKLWSITPEPIRDKGEYVITHGFGYSKFTHCKSGILGEITVFPSKERSAKLIKVSLNNLVDKERNIGITYIARLCLGDLRENNYKKIYTVIDKENKYIYGINPYSSDFSSSHVYLKISGGKNESFSGDERDFIVSKEYMYSLSEQNTISLSGRCGSGLEPVLSEKVYLRLGANEEKSLVIVLGAEDSIEGIQNSLEEFSDITRVEKELEMVKGYWERLLTKIKIKTEDKALDFMINGWLPYETISCRLFSRTAFYQCGGAYGFRDQLQDSIPMIYIQPEIARNQILYSATRQFEEGDVQHWWHPVVNSGIRTRFSDDLLWLPYVTCIYVKTTGDYKILDEEIGYLKDEPLREGEDERYNVSSKSDLKESLYNHCIRAINRSLKFGYHNIPLMGSGDWNDGMSTVGNKGKGESIWLGWFLYAILKDFKDLCIYKRDEDNYEKYIKTMDFIKENLEIHGWDGSWYKRAYFDDGTPLGSHENQECKIDALSQCWSVISEAGDKERANIAMSSLEKYLVKPKEKIILLLSPPFDKSDLKPGYIKGYVPGVRENGGQYTHGVAWVALALAKLGRGEEAYNIYSMLNPINHSLNIEEANVFKTEPYVMAADIYSVEPHEGRGGWSWYTGSSGWMYTIALEHILGFRLIEGKGFKIKPCVPKDFKEYSIDYVYGNAVYHIKVIRSGNSTITLDGNVIEGDIIPVTSDGEHEVKVNI